MSNRIFPFFVPLVAFLIAIVGIVSIGELLLFTARSFEDYGEAGKLATPLVALGLIALIGTVATLLSARANKLPPVELPEPAQSEPVRRIDFGAGAIVGQFVFFTALGLVLLFIILAIS